MLRAAGEGCVDKEGIVFTHRDDYFLRSALCVLKEDIKPRCTLILIRRRLARCQLNQPLICVAGTSVILLCWLIGAHPQLSKMCAERWCKPQPTSTLHQPRSHARGVCVRVRVRVHVRVRVRVRVCARVCVRVCVCVDDLRWRCTP